MKVAINFTGGSELARALRGLDHAVASRLGINAVRAGARVIAASAKRRVPVNTGLLRESIRTFDDIKTNKTGGRERTVFVGTRVFYGYWVEFGTAHTAPRGFLRAARDNQANEAVDVMARNLGEGIEREVGRAR